MKIPPQYANCRIYINGKELHSNAGFYESHGIVLGPVRELGEAMNLGVTWEAVNRQITFSSGSDVLIMTVNSSDYTFNGTIHSMTVPPVVTNGRTLVPLQAVVEAFGGVFEKRSSDAALCGLTVGIGRMYPAFTPNNTQYELSVFNNADSICLKPIVNESHATLTIDGKPALSGQLSEAISILPGPSKDILIVVTAQDGTTSKTYKLTVKRVVTANLDPDNKNVDIGSVPMSINIPIGVTDAALVVTTNLQDGKQQATLPLVDITSNTSIGEVRMLIPENTVVSGPNGSWSGKINVPTIKPNNSVTIVPDTGNNATVGSVIEVGFGDIPLIFNRAVRIVVPGQAGKDVGYSRGSTFTKIDRVCQMDDQEWADANIPAGGEGKINVGPDLVVWTKHFTMFATYTQNAVPTGGGSGGGSSLASSGTLISSINGGTINESGVTVFIPDNALKKDIRVNVKKITDLTSLPLPTESQFVGCVMDITKDQTDNFDKAVTISMPWDQTKIDSNKYELAIYWLDAKNHWVILDNIRINKTTGYISGEVNHFTIFALIAKQKTVEKAPVPVPLVVSFSDIKGNYAENSIKALAASGIVCGYADGSFKPDEEMSRAEFSSLLAKAFNLDNKNGKVFDDTANHWARDAIAAASASGIINGYNNEIFGPDDNITREQMAVMIFKAARLEAENEESQFVDKNKISAWALSAVNSASSQQLITGFPDKTFKPQGNVTRAQAAAVVYRVTSSNQ